MHDYRIEDVADIVNFMRSGRDAWMFRGVANIEHKLIPSIGRTNRKEPFNRLDEQHLLIRYMEQARAHLKFDLSTTLEWMIFAQHHGLPTRLLDWSQSPLVAAYFAVETSMRQIILEEVSGAVSTRDVDGAIRHASTNSKVWGEPRSFRRQR